MVPQAPGGGPPGGGQKAATRRSRRREELDKSMNEATARPLIKAILEGDIMQAQGIVLAGVDVNSAVDEDGNTALHLSSMQGLSGLSRMLIEQSADIDAEAGPMKYTPLHLAALQNREVVITLLLDSNASVNVLSTQGDTPLALSSAYGTLEAVQRLLAARADPDVPSEQRGAVRRVLYSEDQSVFTTSLSSNSCTAESFSRPACSALLRAVKSDADFQVVKAIAEVKADLSVSDSQQNQLMHLAVEFGNLRVVRMLLDFRANVNSLNMSQRSPLHTAAEKGGHKKIIRLLVERKACLNGEDHRGVSALQLSSDALIEQQLYLLGARRGRAQVHTTGGSTHLQAGVSYRPEGDSFRIIPVSSSASTASPLRVLPDPGGGSSGSSWQGTPLAQRRAQSLGSIGLGSSPASSPPSSPDKSLRRRPKLGDSSLLSVPAREYGSPQVPSPSRNRLPEVSRTPPLSPLGPGPSSLELLQPLRPRSRLAGDSSDATRLRPLGLSVSQRTLSPAPSRQARSMRDFAAHLPATAPVFAGDDCVLQGISPIPSPKGADGTAILT